MQRVWGKRTERAFHGNQIRDVTMNDAMRHALRSERVL